MKALVDRARSSACQDGLPCAVDDGKESNVLEKIVVRSGQPSEEVEYEYYYVDDDTPNSELPRDRLSRSVAVASGRLRGLRAVVVWDQQATTHILKADSNHI
ncbi:hypothetical protein MTO96_014078 [Rhipicephalus appendiculatus]